jgi:hypothetical protein
MDLRWGQARDQRCASRGIYEILESLTCGGFPISGKGIGIRRKSDQRADVMSVFLKICDSPSKAISSGSITRSTTESHTFPALCIGHSVSVFTDHPVSGNAILLAQKQTRRLADLGNQGHQIVVKLWFTIVKYFPAQC